MAVVVAETPPADFLALSLAGSQKEISKFAERFRDHPVARGVAWPPPPALYIRCLQAKGIAGGGTQGEKQMALIYSCYGSGCPNERWDGECKVHGNVRRCPIETPEEELEEDDFWREYWEDIKAAEARGE